jgi:hypothetical protein
MKISDWFVPRYLHSDPSVRLKFVSRTDDVKLLKQMSEKDDDVQVRQAAEDRARILRGEGPRANA